MNPSLDKALYYLTGNGNIDEVAIEDVERLTKEHPYFSVAQLLLAKKMKISDDLRLPSQLQKTALYFSNPYWLHYQLLNYPPTDVELYSSAKDAEVEDDHAKVFISINDEHLHTNTEASKDIAAKPLAPVDIDSHIATAMTTGVDLSEDHVEASATDVPITTEFTADEIEHASELAYESLSENLRPENFAAATAEITEEDFSEPVPITTEFTADEIENASELAHESLSEDLTAQMFTPATSGDVEEEVSEPVAITTEFTADELEHASELAHESLSEALTPEMFMPASEETTLAPGTAVAGASSDIDEPATSSAQAVETDDDEKRIDDEEAFPWKDDEDVVVEKISAESAPFHVSQGEEEMASIVREPDEMTTQFIEEVAQQETGVNTINKKEEYQQPAEMPEEDEHEKMFQSIKAMLDATTEEAGKAVPGGAIPIDPYHTIDYFASQGIKLELEQFPEDKLGKQVKKFTHWLRQMKKLGPEDALETIENAQAEAAVQKIADTSNTAREVVTEAMAQVLEKQGKKEKAVQLYIKLSFLNPDKSAYFADKIKNLKGI